MGAPVRTRFCLKVSLPILHNMSDEISMEVQQQPVAVEIADSSTSADKEMTSEKQMEAEMIKQRMEEMEREAAKLRELHAQLSEDKGGDTEEERRDIDSRSIYIGNVDYGATPLELQQHFSSSGVVNRVTILTNKHTGQPKGFAYLEFADVDGVNKAVATQDGSSFHGRELKVSAKRTNIPGVNSRGGRGGFRGRGAFRARGRGGRGRGRGPRGGGRFAPY